MKTINSLRSKLLTLTLALMASVSSLAYDFGDDGLFFNIIDNDNKLVEVTYQHERSEENYSKLTHVTIPDTVLRGRVKYAVVGIGVSAFKGCTTLESIVLPNTINHIGVAAFSGCTALRSIDLPSSIKRIEGQVFYHCSSLVSVNIPDGITHLGNNAFTGCQSLLGIVIPNSVTSIGKEVFRDCKSLTKMIIPNSVTELGEGMFWQCSSLDSVSISTGLTTLTRGTFTHCTALRNIVVPQNITHVGDYTFYGCTNLDTIVFYNSNTTFDKYAFEYYSYEYDAIYQFNSIEECCSNQITKNMTDINTYPNRIYYVNGERLSKDLVIPEGIDTIAPFALAYTDQFKSIAIPSTMKSIDEYSLFNCSAIREVHWNATNYPDASSDVRGPFSKKLYEQIETITFGDSVEHIPANVFSNMYKLRSIVIPKNVKSIGNNAFNHYCQELKTVICLAPNPPLLGEKVFSRSLVLSQDSSKRVSIYVPNEYVDIYKEQWSQYDIRPLFPTLWGLQRTSCTKTIGEDEYGTVWGSRSYLMQETQTTTIDGKQYMVFGDDQYNRFALREENNKILVYSSILKKDLVLYDFTLEVGDSLPALYFEERAHDTMQQWLYIGDIVDYNKDDDGTILPAETFIVTDISTITLLDGKEYKKWTFDNGMEYVEGIGSFGTSYAWNDFYQLIANGPLYSDVFSQHLVCASKNGQLLYKMDEAEMERLGAECLCEVETSYKSQWCNTWNLFRHSGGARLDSEETWQYKLDRDTIINGKLYSTVIYYLTSDPSREYYMGAVRFGDDRKVYRAIGNSESVVYDFTAQVGDTLGPGVVYDVEVDSLTNLKTIYFHPYDRYEDKYIEYATVKWIEGVGSTDGFLLAIDYGTAGGPSFYLLCAYRDDELKYAANKDLGCRYNAGEVTHEHFPTLAGLSRTIHEERSTNDTTRRDDFTKVVLDRKFPTLYHSQMYLRERDNKIFVESRTYKNLTELYEYVLYDFTLEVGDSLPMLYIDYSSRGDWGPIYPLSILNVVNYRKEADGTIYPGDTLVVTEVSTITLLDGKEYKKWTFNNGMEYAEGIGSLSGDFYELIANKRTTEDLTASQLVCASQNGQLLYKMDDAEMERLGVECLCEYNSGPKKDNAKNGKIGGRPTPTQWNMLEFETKEVDGTPTITRAETFSYTLENDSIVAKGKTFYQLARQSTKDTAITKSFVGALHFGEDEDNRVYFLRDGVEYVLYDFTAEPGDTIEIFAGINNYPQYTTYTHVVTGKDTLENGACRMILEVVFPEETSSVENAQKVWLAGLGSIDGIVHNAAKRTSDAHAAPARSAHSSDTQTSVMLCAWRDDDCLYTTDHPDYDSYGCVYNLLTSIKDIETPGGKCQKLIRDGHLYIIHNGTVYNVIGLEVK